MLSFISKVSKNTSVVYIKTSLFPRLPNIKKRIEKISEGCNFSTDLTNENSNIVLYFRNIFKVPDIENIEYNTQNIYGFLRYDFYKDYIEIYDVCVPIEHRRKGVMKTIISDLFEKKFKNIWLGVDMNNPMRDKVIELYSSLGFIFDGLRTNTPSGKNISFFIVSMIKKSNLNQSNLNEINLQINNALDNMKTSVDLFLNFEDALKIHKITSNKGVEYSGIFNVDKKNYLKPEITNIGTSNNVPMPDSHISWHSHPLICYRNNNCYIGWPSGIDMSSIFFTYHNGLLLHFIFAQEGLYIVRLTEELMKLFHIISNEQKWIQDISDLIAYRFSFLEQFRNIPSDIDKLNCFKNGGCLEYQSQKRIENINLFLNISNTYPLNKYIVTGQERTNLLFAKFPIDELNDSVTNTLNYYEKFTYRIPDFPVFHVEYIPTYNVKTGVKKINLKYIPSPFNPSII